MKKESNMTTLLGVTQQEAAMLLGVSRSQWSMYELGKRDLPLPALQLLSEMLVYIQTSETTTKRQQASQLQVSQQELERLLRENEYQQLLLARKTAIVEKKQATQLRLSLLVTFLNNRETTIGKARNISHQSLTNKVTQINAADYSAALLQHEIKQDILNLEKQLLEEKIQNLK